MSNATVSIVTYTALEQSKRCIQSVLEGGGDPNLILTANGPKAATYFNQIASQHPNVTVVIYPRNAGFIEPSNHALTLCDTPYFVTLNDDATVPLGWLDILEQPFKDYPTAALTGAVGCALKPDMIGYESDNVEYIEMSCAMTKTEIARKYGLFSTYLTGAYCEDADFSLRLREQGYTIHRVPLHITHERFVTSKKVPEAKAWFAHNIAVMRKRWKHYIETRRFDYLVTKPVKAVVVYVYPQNGNGQYHNLASRFAHGYEQFKPGFEHDIVIVCNGSPVTDKARKLFERIPNCQLIAHDNTGFDIGAYQRVAREYPADLMVFFGASTYLKRFGWLGRMVQAFEKHGPALYGSMGNTGVLHRKVFPHIRTTGFWIPPSLLNEYPVAVTKAGQRYEFEHGPNCLTSWIYNKGLKAWIVTWDNEYLQAQWDKIPDGFHRNDQSALLCGDRISEPPYHPIP